jgi:hypothetical protein
LVAFEIVTPSAISSAAPRTVKVPVPSALLWPALIVPPLTVTPPVKLLLPLRTSVPVPVLFSPH